MVNLTVAGESFVLDEGINQAIIVKVNNGTLSHVNIIAERISVSIINSAIMCATNNSTGVIEDSSIAVDEIQSNGNCSGGLVQSNIGVIRGCNIETGLYSANGYERGGLAYRNSGTIGACYIHADQVSWVGGNSIFRNGGLVSINDGTMTSSYLYISSLLSSWADTYTGYIAGINNGTINNCCAGDNYLGSGNNAVSQGDGTVTSWEVYPYGGEKDWVESTTLMNETMPEGYTYIQEDASLHPILQIV